MLGTANLTGNGQADLRVPVQPDLQSSPGDIVRPCFKKEKGDELLSVVNPKRPSEQIV